MKKYSKRIMFGVGVAIGLLLLGWFLVASSKKQQPFLPNTEYLPKYIASTLAQYDGRDQNSPIYIALDGYVYDVTPGREFYGVGGTYHALAGKDASKDLHIFGGSIVKEKYKIVGVFVE